MWRSRPSPGSPTGGSRPPTGRRTIYQFLYDYLFFDRIRWTRKNANWSTGCCCCCATSCTRPTGRRPTRSSTSTPAPTSNRRWKPPRSAHALTESYRGFYLFIFSPKSGSVRSERVFPDLLDQPGVSVLRVPLVIFEVRLG